MLSDVCKQYVYKQSLYRKIQQASHPHHEFHFCCVHKSIEHLGSNPPTLVQIPCCSDGAAGFWSHGPNEFRWCLLTYRRGSQWQRTPWETVVVTPQLVQFAAAQAAMASWDTKGWMDVGWTAANDWIFCRDAAHWPLFRLTGTVVAQPQPPPVLVHHHFWPPGNNVISSR